jgi:hypothetical protein
VRRLLAALAILLSPDAFAGITELRELYRGAKAQAMGGASVAMVEDEQAIFLNPAGLAGVKKSLVNYMVIDIEASSDTIASVSDLSTLNNFNASALNRLIGKDVYGRVQISPSIAMPSFGLALLVDQQNAVLAKNLNLPQVTVGYQSTYGFQFGYGTSIRGNGRASRRGRGGRKSSSIGRGDLRVGIAGKVLWRRGSYQLLPFTEIMNVSQDTITGIMGTYGIGFGADIGTQYVMPVSPSLQLSAGFALSNIGGVSFSSGADSQPSAAAFGLGLKYSMQSFGARLAWDYRNAFADADWRKKTHIGLALDIPMFSIYAGLNQMKYSYGLGFDLWLFQVTAVSYAEELGAILNLDTERRYLLQLALKF